MARAFQALVLVILAAAVSCAKEEQPAVVQEEVIPNAIAPVEAERGVKSCEAFAAKVCECSVAEANYVPECELATGKIEALDLALRVTRSKMTPTDMGAALYNARLIMKTCFEDTARLASDGCDVIPSLGDPSLSPKVRR